jgi:hypothetical protein
MLAKDCPNKGDLNRCPTCGAEWVCPKDDRYYLSAMLGSEKVEREVTLEEFCRAERAAGFRPKLPSSDRFYMVTPATGGFSSGAISGRVAPGVSEGEKDCEHNPTTGSCARQPWCRINGECNQHFNAAGVPACQKTEGENRG